MANKHLIRFFSFYAISGLSFLTLNAKAQFGASPWTPASGTYTVPADVSSITIEAWGGGGGGGGANSSGGLLLIGGGGGGGAYTTTTVAVTAGQTLVVVVGSAGTAGAANNGNGGNGSASTVTLNGTLVASADFGRGSSSGTAGKAANCTPSVGAHTGGKGGAGAAGDTWFDGGSGGGGAGSTANGGTENTGCCGVSPDAGGTGGATGGGNGGNGGSISGGTEPCCDGHQAGVVGNAPGGGGGGAVSSDGNGSSAGGAGAAGKVIITYLSTLPINLLSFNAQYNEISSVVDLAWATATEINSKEFSVEKSTDGLNWTVATTIAGAGNSNRTINYTTNDESPFDGVSYYRLKQMDNDGKYRYSDVRTVSVNAVASKMSIVPNPAKNNVTISFGAFSKDIASVNIYDCTGRLMNSIEANTVKGVNSILLNISGYSEGLYMVRAITPQKQYTSRMIVGK